MVRSKASSKKPQKRGIDFKKIKRKIGRKLPPPKNATNTEIKSKAIILPEQSVASEKAGLAVNKKGLTLKELLQQTSHHNSKIRKDALLGVRDLLVRHPTELRSHRYAVIEKLRERINDDDKVVRETLYQLLKSVIFPGCKEETQGLFISLPMAYIFNAMTHLSIDVRMMAFKFFELVVEYYPSSFFMYADKILQNYEEILQKNQLYLQDKGKLKNALTGLVHCLSLLPSNQREIGSSKNNVSEEGILHAFEPDIPTESAGPCVIIKKLEDLVLALLNCFQEFMPLVYNAALLNAQVYDCMLYVVRSIHLAVRYILYVTETGNAESQSPCEESGKLMEGTISSALLKNLLSVFPLTPLHHLSEKDHDRFHALNIVITEIFLHSSKCIKSPDAIFERFLEFIENSMLGKIISGLQSGKVVREKHILPLLPFIPKLVAQVAIDWKLRLLEGFTLVFKDCHPESSLKLACLKVIEELLVPRGDVSCLDARFPEILELQVTWIRELPLLLILLGDKNPSCSEVVLHLLLRVGQSSFVNSSLQLEYDNTQYPLQDFYTMKPVKGNSCYSLLTRLPTECQELSICCLFYFSYLDPLLLKSLASCCLCPELHPDMLFRIIEVLHSTYKVGHIHIADYISFCVTLISRFEDFPENGAVDSESKKKNSSYGTLKSITRITCSCLSQIGDNFTVSKTLEKVIVDQISVKPPLDNACALLRILISLDSRNLRLSEQSIITLSNFLPGYMIDAMQFAHKYTKGRVHRCHYYLLPCFFLFYASRKLLFLALEMMGSSLSESRFGSSHDSTSITIDPSSLISAIVSILLLMHKDTTVQRFMASFKAEIDCILQNILKLQALTQIFQTIEGRHKVQCAVDELKILICALPDGINATQKLLI